jgi:hypothetical protein
MDWINNGFGLVATVFGVLALIGGGAGYFKASRGDSIIKYQALENDALRRRVGDLEKEIVTKDASIKTSEAACLAKDETITELKRNNSYLQKLGQGSPQLKKLTTAVENQTKLINKLLADKTSVKEKNKDAA